MGGARWHFGVICTACAGCNLWYDHFLEEEKEELGGARWHLRVICTACTGYNLPSCMTTFLRKRNSVRYVTLSVG